MNNDIIMIDNEPHRLFVTINSDLNVNVQAIPEERFNEYKLETYDGVEIEHLPRDIREDLDECRYPQINVGSAIYV